MIDQVLKSVESLFTGDEALKKVPVVPFDRTEKEPKKGLRVTLYDVRENLNLRDETPRRLPGDDEAYTLKKMPPVMLDLSLVITAEAATPAEEQKILSDVLRICYRNPILPATILSEDVKTTGSGKVHLTVAQMDHKSHLQPEQIFRALQMPMKPAVWLVASFHFDPWTPTPVRKVRQALLGLGFLKEGNTNVQELTHVQLSAAGIVVDPVGAPLEGVTVKVDGSDVTAKTDDQGFFYLCQLPPRKYKLTFTSEGFLENSVEVTAPPLNRADLVTPVEVQMKDANAQQAQGDLPDIFKAFSRVTYTLRGSLKYPNGDPATAIPLKCGEALTVTDKEGNYVFENLPNPTVAIFAEIPGKGMVKVDVSKEDATITI